MSSVSVKQLHMEHVFSALGMAPDPQKVEATLNWPAQKY